MMDIAKELKNFMIKRRRFDLVAGIVLAGAFRPVITSLIHDVILPPVSALTAGKNIPNLAYIIKKSKGTTPPIVIGYGRFIQATIDFLVIGAVVIMILRVVDKVTEKGETRPSKDQLLLKEIRNLLQQQVNGDKSSSPVSREMDNLPT